MLMKWYIYTMEYYSTIKQENFVIYINRDEPGAKILSEVS